MTCIPLRWTSREGELHVSSIHLLCSFSFIFDTTSIIKPALDKINPKSIIVQADNQFRTKDFGPESGYSETEHTNTH